MTTLACVRCSKRSTWGVAMSEPSSTRLGPLVMVVPEAHKAFGLARAVPNLKVLTCSDGVAVDALRDHGAEVVSITTANANTTAALIDSSEAKEQLRAWAPARVLVFRSSVRTTTVLRELGLDVLAAEPGVARKLENKKAFRELANAAGLPVVQCEHPIWPPTGDLDIGWPRVVQTARGNAGKRTWHWDEATLPALPKKLWGKPVLVAPFLAGATWTINGVVGDHATVLGAPMRQIAGDSRLNPNPFSSAGAAFNPPAPEGVFDRLNGLARSVGDLARDLGFRGFFGIDAVGDEPDEMRLIEMNSRLTATLAAATLAEIEAGQTPLIVWHMLALAGEPIPEQAFDSRAVTGGHLIIRSGGAELEHAMAGCYRIGPKGVARVSADLSWPQPGDVAVWPAGSGVGGPQDEQFRLLSSSPLVDESGSLLSPVADVLEIILAKT